MVFNGRMLFKIFDVGHGFCALAIARNGNVMLFDCGRKAEPERRPSMFLRSEHNVWGIECLFVTNFDEDHIRDLPSLVKEMPISTLTRNPSLTPELLRAIKGESGPISAAMKDLLALMEGYSDTSWPPPPTPGITYRTYWNSFPDFTDTNNLSLVVFLEIGWLRVLMPGDLERQGWLRLLENPRFRADLAGVNVFVASHHGREDGYCPEVFEYCNPAVVVFSDDKIVYETQGMAATYARHARGMMYNGELRRVLTTRCDRDIWWNP